MHAADSRGTINGVQIPITPLPIMLDDRAPGSTLKLTVTWATLLKILAAVLLAFMAVKLWPLAEILFLALLIAIAFWPLLRWTETRGWPKWAGVLIASLLLSGFVIVFLGILVPAIGNQ